MGDSSICAAGDWLQGPYVYYLYRQYGFDKGDIGRLFIAGFGSSMLFGTIVGSLADKQCVSLRSLSLSDSTQFFRSRECAFKFFNSPDE